MGIAYADRTRVLTHQLCPRKRYFEYEVPTSGSVPGIRPNRLNPDLVIGSGFHTGIENLLLGKSVDEAVDAAIEGTTDEPGFWPLVKSQGLILGDLEDASYVYREAAALIEAFIRAYAKWNLPVLQSRFEIVEVEREDESRFILPDDSFTLRWGSRVDALLMEKDTLDLYALSLKTTREYGPRSIASASHDMQGLSEIAAVDQRLRRWAARIDEATGDEGETIPKWFIDRHVAGASPHVLGVKMEYALKGLRLESPKGSGQWYYNNALIRPWKKTDDLDSMPTRRRNITSSFGSPYAISYEFQDDLGGNHRLGKGWNRINIWEDMGVKAWIDYVAEEEIQSFRPGTLLENTFVLPEEYFRNDDDIIRWEKRVLYQEKRVLEGREKLKEVAGTSAFEDVLDEYFEPHSGACDYPTRCTFQEICFGPKAYLHNPIGSGLYTIREANHKTEEKK